MAEDREYLVTSKNIHKYANGGVYIGNEEPIDGSATIWINPEGTTDGTGGVILIDTLPIGSTTLTFTNDAIGDNSFIDIFSKPFGLIPKDMSQSGNTITLTFDAQTNEYSIAIKVVNE